MYEIMAETPEPTSTDFTGPKYHKKRDSTASTTSYGQPVFPNMIKMVEKRKPFGNIEPYCQQMVVLDDFVGIVPKPNGYIVNIEEEEFQNGQLPEPTGSSKRSDAWLNGRSLDRRDEYDVMGDLESFCVCEWRFPNGP